MQIVALILGIPLGWTMGAFTLGQILIHLKFGIPTVVRFKNLDILDNSSLLKRFLLAVILLPIIYIIPLAIAIFFWQSFIGPYLVGSMFAFIVSNGAAKANEANISDFVEQNQRYFTVNINELDPEYLFNPVAKYQDSIEDNEVFARVIGEGIANISFYAICVFFISAITNFFWWAGAVLAVPLGLFLAFCVVHGVIVAILGFITFFANLFSKEEIPIKYRICNLATIMFRLTEETIFALYIWYLYKVVF